MSQKGSHIILNKDLYNQCLLDNSRKILNYNKGVWLKNTHTDTRHDLTTMTATVHRDDSSNRPFLASSSESGTDSDPVKPIDSEGFIRQTFDTDPDKAYELLFKRYYRPLCSHAVRFVYSKEVAEDIVVDVFSQFWSKQTYQSVTVSYRAYLYTSVRHAALAYLKSEFGREQSMDTISEPFTADNQLTPQHLLQYDELQVKIDEIIRSASPQSQKVFIMSRFDGKKNGEIAQELDISIKTVEGHITKVLTILRRTLSDLGMMSLLISSWIFTSSQG